MLTAHASQTAANRPEAISGLTVLRHGVEAALVLVIAVIVSQAVWFGIYGSDALRADISPAGSAARTAESTPQTIGDLSGVFAPVAQSAAPVAPESRLGFTLRGVRVGATPGDGSAIIDIPGEGQLRVAAGETLSANIVLEEVHADRVVINRRGVLESLFLTDAGRRRAQSGAAQPAAAAPVESDGATVQMSERQMARGWLSGLSLEPVYENGAVRGLRVDGDAAQLANLGLEPGDVVLSLNAAPLTSEAAAVRAFALLESADMAVARIWRDGEDITVETSLR
ncbi:type II secretion system protein N [Oceanicaulis alexandrii]|uniref:type II secretion system protein N n=1 Tax=Oceanicaulis alexandrii TaxID=153233 RepID=UPI0003B5FB4B|nr:type II secretion system protein N [Oceanicaulis alexandrii]